jgi:hypothetical protein
MTAGRDAFEQITGRADWDMLQPDTRLAWEHRARGERPFIVPDRPEEVEAEPEHIVSVDPAEVVAWREAEKGEIPRGATAVANTARDNGWEVSVRYARGPWYTNTGRLKLIVPGQIISDDEEEEEDAETGEDSTVHKVPAIYSTIAVWARRGAQRVAATWIHKPWTKAGAEGKSPFVAAHIWPAHNGGGLHNSIALKAHLKEVRDE